MYISIQIYGIYTYGIYTNTAILQKKENFKLQSRGFSLICLPFFYLRKRKFVICLFVDKETKGS